MYFDFWDNRPDTPRLSSPMTPREKGLLAVVVHLLFVIVVLVWPELPFVKEAEARRQQEVEAQRQQQLQQQERPRFVFMQPKVEMRAAPPERAELSDLDRRAASIERPSVSSIRRMAAVWLSAARRAPFSPCICIRL